MKLPLVSISLVLLLALTCLASCADETTVEVTELSVSQVVDVDYGSVIAGAPEAVTLNLDVLDTVPDLATNRELFQCASLYPAKTRLTARELESPVAGETALSAIAQFRTQGDAQWVPLATFDGEAGPSSVMTPLPGAASALDNQKLQVALLGQPTRMVLHLEAESAEPLDRLALSLELTFFFSSDPGGCDLDALLAEPDQGDAPFEDAR